MRPAGCAALLLALLALLSIQTAVDARPLGGDSEAKLRRYVSGLPTEDIKALVTAEIDSDEVFDGHLEAMGSYQPQREEKLRLQDQATEYWEQFRSKEVHGMANHETKYADVNEWMAEWEQEEYMDGDNGWGEEQQEMPVGQNLGYEDEGLDYEVQHPESKLDLNTDLAEAKQAEDWEMMAEEGEEPTVHADYQDAEDGWGNQDEDEDEAEEDSFADWVLALATSMRSGDEAGMERAITMAIDAGEGAALEEVITEASDMEHGNTLFGIWSRLRKQMSNEDNEEMEREMEEAEMMEEQAEGMEVEAEEFLGEAEDLKEEADELERGAHSINLNANEYERLEVTDELGETAEALDSEATKLELEAAKLKAEAVRLGQQADFIESNAAAGGEEEDEAEWLDQEATRLNTEANLLTQEAESLKETADRLDVEADRIDRIEQEKLDRDEESRQARIEEDLKENRIGDYGENEDGGDYDYDSRPSSAKQPLSHAALVSRFKTLLHTH